MNRSLDPVDAGPVRVGPHDRVARQVVGQVGEPAPVQQRRRRRAAHGDAHPRHHPARRRSAAPVSAASGTKRRSKSSDHDDSSSSSGAGDVGHQRPAARRLIASSCWYDASRLRIAPIAWRATTRRVTKLRPLRIRSTSYRTGRGVTAADEVGTQRVDHMLRRRRSPPPRAAPGRRSVRRTGRPTDTAGRYRQNVSAPCEHEIEHGRSL